ncbi:hypothetical protein IWX91DRAFT_177885 [Phyllosticta citricarpa]
MRNDCWTNMETVMPQPALHHLLLPVIFIVTWGNAAHGHERERPQIRSARNSWASADDRLEEMEALEKKGFAKIRNGIDGAKNETW